MRVLGLLISTLLLSVATLAPADAGRHSSYRSGYHYRTHYSSAYRGHHSRIHRSESAKRDFERMTGYPHGRPGYVVDHIVPLACGGADAPSNMQWQTIAAGKAKDKWERKGCSRAGHHER
jgi:hypothetical protein